MPIQIIRSTEMKAPSLVMCIYGPGGVGKSTLASTAPKPIFIDAEEGTKAFGARGIDVPVINIKKWSDVQEAWSAIKDDKSFETVVIDPVGAFLDCLIDQVKAGSEMNIKKWGEAKDKMRKFIWTVKSSGKHVIFVAHEELKGDEDVQLRQPLLAANLSQELVNLCDVVGHYRVDNNNKRSILVRPDGKFSAKDRFDALGKLVDVPDLKEDKTVIAKMIQKIHASYDKPPFETDKK